MPGRRTADLAAEVVSQNVRNSAARWPTCQASPRRSISTKMLRMMRSTVRCPRSGARLWADRSIIARPSRTGGPAACQTLSHERPPRAARRSSPGHSTSPGAPGTCRSAATRPAGCWPRSPRRGRDAGGVRHRLRRRYGVAALRRPRGSQILTAELDPKLASAAAEIFDDDDQVEVVAADWSTLRDRGPFSLLFLDAREPKDAGVDAVVDLVGQGGIVVLDDFTPCESWPPMFAGRVDSLREEWLSRRAVHDRRGDGGHRRVGADRDEALTTPRRSRCAGPPGLSSSGSTTSRATSPICPRAHQVDQGFDARPRVAGRYWSFPKMFRKVHDEDRQQPLHERSDRYRVEHGTEAEDATEQPPDPHHGDLDAGAHQPDRSPYAGAGRSSARRVGRGRTGADVIAVATALSRTPPQVSATRSQSRSAGAISGERGVRRQADHEGVGDRAQPRQLAQRDPEHEHQQAHRRSPRCRC